MVGGAGGVTWIGCGGGPVEDSLRVRVERGRGAEALARFWNRSGLFGVDGTAPVAGLKSALDAIYYGNI